MILETYEKQPWEDKDYDIDFTDWLVSGDELSTSVATVVSTTGEAVPTLECYQVDVSGSGIKAWVRGGTDGHSYKVTFQTTTTNPGNPRKDESELLFKVKEA